MNLDQDRIESLIKSLKLVENGVYCAHLSKYASQRMNQPYVFTEETKPVFEELLEIIPILYEKKHTSVRTGLNSYMVKHQIEPFLKGGYVDSTTTILAFAYLGYGISNYHDADQNVSIKAKIKHKTVLQDPWFKTYIRKLKSKF